MNPALSSLPRGRHARPVLACGAWLKNTACLLDGTRVHWSVPHGDLSEPAACRSLEQSLLDLTRHAGTRLAALAHDLHPDFPSSRLAAGLGRQLGLPVLAVQHHHAHIAAVQAEHGRHEPVIGLALDGVGLGTDGLAWGGELLWVHGSRWQRLGHLWPLALPGGDRAAREPWRMAAAALHAAGRGAQIGSLLGPLVGQTAALTVQAMLARGLNSPVTTSAGRWFDAAAGALGLWQGQRYEAEAAQALERMAAEWLGSHPLTLEVDPRHYAIDDHNRLDLRTLLTALFERGHRQPAARAACAARFHLTLAQGLADWAGRAAREHRVARVALGGGCFVNRVLTKHLTAALRQQGLDVLLPRAASCGDAGLALGQAWVAADTLRLGRMPDAPPGLRIGVPADAQAGTEAAACA